MSSTILTFLSTIFRHGDGPSELIFRCRPFCCIFGNESAEPAEKNGAERKVRTSKNNFRSYLNDNVIYSSPQLENIPRWGKNILRGGGGKRAFGERQNILSIIT